MYEGYFFDEQIAKFQIQFMSIFKGLQVKTGKRADGKERMLEVPVVYGSKDRVTAAIIAQNTQNAMLRLPLMSAYMSGIAMAPERYKGVGTQRRTTYLPKGGEFPTDIKTVVQHAPVAYMMQMKLSIYSSNMYQHRQILEQILVFFDPLVQIQKSDDVFDLARITTVELKDIGLQEEYPSTEKPRAIVTEMTFDVPIWLTVPANIKNEFVEKIYMRLQVIDASENFADYLNDLEIIDENDLIIDASTMTGIQIGEDCQDT